VELSNEDIGRLEEKGYRLEEFAVTDKGAAWLRNVDGYCIFYNRADKKCQVYEKRLMGCYLYPIVCMAKEGPMVDELCPIGHTISKQELRTKGRLLNKLLKKIDNENKH